MVAWGFAVRCSDCNKVIYENDADEAIGGKHAALWLGTLVRFICMPCSEKYDDITYEVTGESYTPIGDTKPKDKEP